MILFVLNSWWTRRWSSSFSSYKDSLWLSIQTNHHHHRKTRSRSHFNDSNHRLLSLVLIILLISSNVNYLNCATTTTTTTQIRRLNPIIWKIQNNMFKNLHQNISSNEQTTIHVNIGEFINIICPKYPPSNSHVDGSSATSMTKTNGYKSVEYHSLYRVSKQEFDECKIRNIESNHPILRCDKPYETVKYTLYISKFSPVPDAIEFVPGNSYYFISTSNGTLNGLNNTNGGTCQSNNMKLVIKVLANLTNENVFKHQTTTRRSLTQPTLTKSPPPTTTTLRPSTTTKMIKEAIQIETETTKYSKLIIKSNVKNEKEKTNYFDADSDVADANNNNNNDDSISKLNMDYDDSNSFVNFNSRSSYLFKQSNNINNNNNRSRQIINQEDISYLNKNSNYKPIGSTTSSFISRAKSTHSSFHKSTTTTTTRTTTTTTKTVNNDIFILEPETNDYTDLFNQLISLNNSENSNNNLDEKTSIQIKQNLLSSSSSSSSAAASSSSSSSSCFVSSSSSLIITNFTVLFNYFIFIKRLIS